MPYKLIKTIPEVTLINGSLAISVVTLQDDSGQLCQIIQDDHCYVVGLINDDIFVPTTHIFPEALKALKGLPNIEYPLCCANEEGGISIRSYSEI